MPDFDYIQFINDTLTRSELDLLNAANLVDKNVDRLLAIRNVFLKKEIFHKVNEYADPMWVANTIFSNGHGLKF
jgi:hypothetical protein